MDYMNEEAEKSLTLKKTRGGGKGSRMAKLDRKGSYMIFRVVTLMEMRKIGLSCLPVGGGFSNNQIHQFACT